MRRSCLHWPPRPFGARLWGALPGATGAADRTLHHHAHLRCGLDACRASHPGSGSVRSLRAPPHRPRGVVGDLVIDGIRLSGSVRSCLGRQPHFMAPGVAFARAAHPRSSAPTRLLGRPWPSAICSRCGGSPSPSPSGWRRSSPSPGPMLPIRGMGSDGALLRRVWADRGRHANLSAGGTTTGSRSAHLVAGALLAYGSGLTAAGRSWKPRSHRRGCVRCRSVPWRRVPHSHQPGGEPGEDRRARICHGDLHLDLRHRPTRLRLPRLAA